MREGCSNKWQTLFLSMHSVVLFLSPSKHDLPLSDGLVQTETERKRTELQRGRVQGTNRPKHSGRETDDNGEERQRNFFCLSVRVSLFTLSSLGRLFHHMLPLFSCFLSPRSHDTLCPPCLTNMFPSTSACIAQASPTNFELEKN